ncbi:hypothetical protein GGS21DRAFT_490230 [Xylaria nigripes]|nr:hypothetical protein GGS21DRAFT_490230 [Xylaria nigripes]
MATRLFEPRQDRRGSVLDAGETSVPGVDSSLDPTIRQLFQQQAEIQAKLDALLPTRCMPSNWVEIDMLRHKLRGLETYARNQNLSSGKIPVLSEIEEARSIQYRCECIESYLIDLGFDLYDPRFLETFRLINDEAPPEFNRWLDQNTSFYDPVFRAWRVRGSSSLIMKHYGSYKCWHGQCIYQIYGFPNAEERDEHMKRHGKSEKGKLGPSAPSRMSHATSDQSQPSGFDIDQLERSSSMTLPRPPVPTTLPGIATITPSGGRRGSVPVYSSVEMPLMQAEAEVDPMLPPLKRSRVGHSRLQSIGELRLPRDTDVCLRCKLLAKPCDSKEVCTFCCEDPNGADNELWTNIGCHRGSLVSLIDQMLPEALSPKQTHTPVTSPMARRRNMNEHIERTYLFSQGIANMVKSKIDFNDGFWWTEDLATSPVANPAAATYSREPKEYAPPVLKVFAASWNAEGVIFKFWELLKVTGYLSENRESEAAQYPMLYRAKLLLREILFYDLQQPEPSIRTTLNTSNAQPLPDDMDYDNRNRLISNCMAQFLQSFEGVTMRRVVLEPKTWLATFISLCIFSIVRTILADLISTPSRSVQAQTRTGSPNSGGAMAMHSVYKALVHVYVWSGPVILDSPVWGIPASDCHLFSAACTAVRQSEWITWGIQSTKDFLLGLGSGYLIDNVGFNGFIRQRTPIYRHISYTQPAVGGTVSPHNFTPDWRPVDPWSNILGRKPASFPIPQERRHTVAESPAFTRAIARGLTSPTKLRTSYQRPPLRRVYCSKCNEYPEGFRGEHELRRHTDAKHAAMVKRWVCAEPPNPSPMTPLPVIPLSKCKACVTHKKYGAYYNAAAHLRRAHFHPHKSGKASGDWPPMSMLKDWMREVRQSIDTNENDTSSGEDESEARMIEEYAVPRQSLYLEGPRLAPAPPQGAILAPSVPSSLESTVNSSPNIAKVEDARSRCPIPDCGRAFKDLVAHMLTHQEERPEKCPIEACDYHVKGFARKYDKNRHALTHYKGSMICPFCPGSGTAFEKSFNRADVFKRHLTSVHNVEQTPPNSRKMTITESGSRSGDAKCSICHTRFSTAQEFYEHLDDCVLNVIGTTPKVPRDRTSTPQKGDQKNALTATGESVDKVEPPDTHSTKRSTETKLTPGSVDHARETVENMDVDSDRGD